MSADFHLSVDAFVRSLAVNRRRPVCLLLGAGASISSGMPRTDNANYLWIQLFHSALNAKGRAGFVMANSASDARSSEQEIRQKLIESRAVDVIVAVGTNMFYTVTLPVLVLNWRQKSSARSQLKLAIEDVLDTLPAAYDRPLYAQKCSALFEHVYESYPECDANVYSLGA